MNKKLMALGAAIAAMLLVSGCGGGAEKEKTAAPARQSITDIAGKTVEAPAEVKKLAVIPLPWASAVYALDGNSSRLAAIHPGAMSAYKGHFLEKLDSRFGSLDTKLIGQDFSINMEGAANMGVDAAVVWAYQDKEAEKLTSMGIPAVRINNGTIDELKQSFLIVAKLLGKEDRAELLNAYYDNTYKKIKEYGAAEAAKKPKILFLRNAKLALQGNDNFIHEAIEIGGGDNPFDQTENARGSNKSIPMEEVYKINPDIILLSNFDQFTPKGLYENTIPGQDWSAVKAVAARRVYKVPMGIYRWDAPGVETPLMMEWLARLLQPEIFKDIDVRADTKKFYKDFLAHDLSDADLAMIFADEANAESAPLP